MCVSTEVEDLRDSVELLGPAEKNLVIRVLKRPSGSQLLGVTTPFPVGFSASDPVTWTEFTSVESRLSVRASAAI